MSITATNVDDGSDVPESPDDPFGLIIDALV